MVGKAWRGIAGAALLWIGLALFEIALVGKLDPQETPVGFAIALLAVAAAVAALRAANLRYGARWRWAGFAALVARNVVRDSFIVFGVLVRRLGGAAIPDGFQDIPFDPGGDEPAAAARRALATAGISTSPNEIVLAIDAERRSMRVHVLAPPGTRRHSERWPL